MKKRKILSFSCCVLIFIVLFAFLVSAAAPEKYQSRFYVDWTKHDINVDVSSSGSSFSVGPYKWITNTAGNDFLSMSDDPDAPGGAYFACINNNYSGMYCEFGSVTADPYLLLVVTSNNRKYIKLYSSSDITASSSGLGISEITFSIKKINNKYRICWYANPANNTTTVQSIEIVPFGESYSNVINSVYSIGENDGLNSGETAKKTIFAVISAPFIALSNILSFEVFGLNFFTLFKILITICLIGFIISRFRKG